MDEDMMDMDEAPASGGPLDVSADLLAFLKEEYDRCEDTLLEAERATALKRYNGEPYGDEVEGWSQVVSRDTAKAVDYMTNSIMRTIVSGDRVVEFAHKNAELANQATEAITYLFMDSQDGYRVLHDWLKAGLLEKNAVSMTFMDHVPAKREVHENVPPEALALAVQQGAEIVQAEEGADGSWSVAEHVEQPPKFSDSAVPNEEFYCSTDAATIDEALMKGRRMMRNVFDLTAEGFDADELGGVDSFETNQLSDARDDGRNNDRFDRGNRAKQVMWHEEFVRFDENGDGIAELLYIRRTSDFKIFAIDEMEEATDHPFVDWCPFPMPHRRIGQSLADKVMPLERINTVLLRQSLDGIYQTNMPTTYLHEDSIGENTIEDILNIGPGRVVRWKGANAPAERQASFTASEGFKAMEMVKGELEELTGITRLNQGLDSETLNKTATGTAMLQAQGQQMEEYLAHNFGNALAKLFTKKARLLKRYGKPMTVPIDGQYKEIDPTKWPDDMIARPRIGLGASRKQQQLAYLQQVMGMQQGLLTGGKAHLVSDSNLFNAAKAFVNTTKLGEVSEWFDDPMQEGPDGQKVAKPTPPPPPDPAMVKVQQDAQAQQAKQHADEVALKAKWTLAEQDQMHRQKMAEDDAAFQAGLAEARAMREADLADAKFAKEMEMADKKFAMELHYAERKQSVAEDLPDNRPGGDLDK